MPHQDDRTAVIDLGRDRVGTQDLKLDAQSDRIVNTTAPPAVRIDGAPVAIEPKEHLRVPVAPGEHRVEMMVKQRYVTVPVAVEDGDTAELRFSYKHHGFDGESHLVVGGKAYAKRALAQHNAVRRGVFCLNWLIAAAALLFLLNGLLMARQSPLAVEQRHMNVVVLAVLAIAVVGGTAVGLATRYRPPNLVRVAPRPLEMPGGSSADPVLVLPAGVAPPQRPGLLLSVRAMHGTSKAIGFGARPNDAGTGVFEFYFNEQRDWVAAPHVRLDGVELGAAWGTWWIPADPGPHRLRIAFDDIGGHRLDGCTTEVDIPVDRSPRQVDARFNFIDMAAQRAEATGVLSRWQRIMRHTGHDTAMTEQAARKPAVNITVR